MDFQTHLIWSNFPFLIQGLWLTLAATAVALFIGIIQGGFFCALKLSNNFSGSCIFSQHRWIISADSPNLKGSKPGGIKIDDGKEWPIAFKSLINCTLKEPIIIFG